MERLSSAFQNNITIAWAIPVSPALLAGRLKAYAETKAAIATFRLVVRNSDVPACHNTPEEIMSLIATFVRDDAFKRTMNEWTTVAKCLTNTCPPFFHVLEDDLDLMDEHGALPDEVVCEAEETHQQRVWEYCELLSNLDGSSRFARCARAFTRDFGIRPYFMMHKTYGDDDDAGPGIIKHVEAKAFLTLPVFSGPITSNLGHGIASTSVCRTMDPSALRELGEGQIRQFTLATNILRLHPHDPETDQISPRDESKGRDWPQLMMLGGGEVEAPCYW